MTNDEQARQRLVEIALREAGQQIVHRRPDPRGFKSVCLCQACNARRRAGFRDLSKGSWNAPGLTAAMEEAGLLVPAPGTPARRGAIALLDWMFDGNADFSARWWKIQLTARDVSWAEPGDIIAWLQHPPPDPAGWRRGHVAVIVAVDDESLTTVGWNEGPSPGRVMMRRLWRDEFHACAPCNGDGFVGSPYAEAAQNECRKCRSTGHVPRSSTVLWRRPGGLYGIARPAAA